ncbi:hypothetical protein [Nakamurella sp.]|uniref:hypothetical protein n=1 Tax=Nakamurella sp. TaxID=1869182 RepID=UPI003B3AD349
MPTRIEDQPAEPALADGRALIELILGSEDWIHRQVERVDIQPTGDTIHRISMDLTVPVDLALPGSRGAVLVPVTLLQKGPLSCFSVVGPDEQPIPMLESAANSRLSTTFLRTLAAATYGYRLADEPFEVGLFIRDVVASDLRRGRQAVDRLRRFLQDRDGAAVDPVEAATFFSMVEVFSRCFLMVVELDERLVGRRCVVKYSYLDTRNDPHDRPRYEMSWDLEHFGVAGSYHFELLSPQLLEISSITLTDVTGTEVHLVTADLPPDGVSTAHLAVRPRARLSTAAVVVGLVPRRYGVVSQSFAATWLVVGVFAAVVAGRAVRDAVLPGATVAPAAAAILSAAGAIALTWIARTPEDRIVAAVLRRPRRHLLGAGALLILAGLYMAVPIPDPVRTAGWWAMLFAAIGIATASTRHRRRSRPDRHRRHPDGGAAGGRAGRRPAPPATDIG